MRRSALIALAFAGCLEAAAANEAFNEDLRLETLNDGKLLAHFDFVTRTTAYGQQILDYGLFPKAIGQVLQEYKVEDLHLTFSQGRWNYDEWGYPPEPSTGTGVELWAWMDASDTIDQRWKSLTNTLSGLFCASLNFIDETLTTEPLLSFQPQSNNTSVRYGSLPHENVCTENLTPWIKLLPCKSKAGIARLLNAHKIYNSNFHSMSIHAKQICLNAPCTQREFELKQTVTSVLDPVRETNKRDWSLNNLFERTLKGACPLAESSLVQVKRDTNALLSPEIPGVNDASSVVYDLHELRDALDISMKWPEEHFQYPVESVGPMVTASRHFTGYGQERGGLRITIHNRNKDQAVSVIYYDAIPWFLKLYLHTLQVEVHGSDTDGDEIIQRMYYQPAVDRARPNQLECEMLLPKNSIVTISLDLDKVFLKYTEHRPDANRGFDVGPAVLTAQLEGSSPIRVYTDTLLVSLPTPDFSMPYNVITLTCTVIALFFGSVFNLLTRSFQVVPTDQEKVSNE
ncbi:hypothetical protein VTP01DRAFT_4216 [Rhizomucor pusillus]|uniref:uncharacterized protein n=1 Tax=Rhizomucor pusillus TaxID=4840 RepID=UPI003743470A